jgi:hypothetical protein
MWSGLPVRRWREGGPDPVALQITMRLAPPHAEQATQWRARLGSGSAEPLALAGLAGPSRIQDALALDFLAACSGVHGARSSEGQVSSEVHVERNMADHHSWLAPRRQPLNVMGHAAVAVTSGGQQLLAAGIECRCFSNAWPSV